MKEQMLRRKFVVDIDGVICTDTKSQYHLCEPFPERIKYFNSLHDQGVVIVYWTGRGGDSGIDWHDFTVKQLKEWGVKYHKLRTDKESYDIWIDDKCMNSDQFFSKWLEDE